MIEFSKRVTQKLSKLSPAQIKNLVDDLTGQSEMFQSIMESLSTGLLIVDPDWRLLEVNKAALRYIPFEQNPEDCRDENQPVWTCIADSDIAAFFKDCAQNDKSNVSNEYTVTTSAGSVRFIDISVSPLVKGGELSGYIITIDDVTEKRNQEVLLHRMETMAGMTNLAASVAHEIKNPLGAISIHIQLMQKALKKKREGDGLLPDPKFAENYLDIVNQEIDRLNKIVVDFLLAVRPVQANMELSDPDKLLLQFADFFKPECQQKNISLETDLAESATRLLIDPKLFREVIVNMAQNSLAAIQEKNENSGGDAVGGQIVIRSCVKNDTYSLLFSDNGSGMSEESLSRVFEPYYTTKTNGTGLGMAMVYKIIKEFSGDISVKSLPGQGTQFLIRLPVPQTKTKLLTHKA